MSSDTNTKSQEEVQNTKFQFLPDDPVSEDFFGCHKRIAESIAEQIESGRKGKTIGLEGTWGSGKSSIIKMLEKKWAGNKKTKVFLYDAWEHQGDNLRRAFLEELIKSLTDKNNRWLENCKRNKFAIESCVKECGKNEQNACPDYVINNLRQRYEHSVIDTEPYITKEGIYFAASTLLMPVWLTLIPIIENIYIRFTLIVLALIPLAVIGDAIRRCYKEGKDYREFISELFGKSKETTRYTTQKTPEPTTIDFQEYYWNLLNKALEHQERRLVVIVDNLDRVDSADALDIWATLKTFLDDKKSGGVDNRVWVIVPYDNDKIVKLWSQNGDTELALHFKEKTFQIRYHVPEPLTSKWESYFNKKLADAIKINDKDIHNNIFNIFRIIALPKYKYIPTPREMKIFINRIVSLALLFYETKDASLEEIALYAAFELPKSFDFRNLASIELEQEKNIINFAGKDYRRGLAVIHYGIQRSEADEVIYKPKIEKYINSGDYENVTPILQFSPAQIICRNYLGSIAYHWQNLNEFLSASEALMNFEPEGSSWDIKQCFAKLAYHMLENVNCDSFKPNGNLKDVDVDGLIRIMAFCPSICHEIIDRISITLAKNYFGEMTDAQVNECLKQWVLAVVSIIRHVESIDEEPIITLRLDSPEHYAVLISFVCSEDAGLIKYFCPKVEVKGDYLNACIVGIKSGTIKPESATIIENILKMPVVDDADKALIAQGITPAYSKLNNEQIVLMYDILYQHRKIKYFTEELEKLVTGNLVFNVLSKFATKPIAAAQCLLNIFLFSSNITANISPDFKNILTNSIPSIPPEIAKAMHKHSMFEDVCSSLSDEIKKSKCWAEVLKNLVKDDDLIADITAERFISDHGYIKEHLDEKFDTDGKEGNYYDNLVKYLSNNGLIEKLLNEPINSNYCYAYYILITEEKIDSLKLEEKLSKELEAIEVSVWLDALTNESKSFGLADVAIELSKKAYKLNLKSEFVDALIKHADGLVKNETDEVSYLKESWGFLLDALAESHRKNDFREQLLNQIIESNKSILPLLGIYSNEIKTALNESKKNIKKDFIGSSCKRIANDNNFEEMKWMLTLFSENESLIKSADNDDLAVLKDRLEKPLNEYWKKNKEESKEVIDQKVIDSVARQLEITLVEKENKDDTTKDPLEKSILGNKYRLVFNPNSPNGSKPMRFGENGQILEGSNNNETTWRIRNENLEFLNSENKIFSRFSYNEATKRFESKNDTDTFRVQDLRHNKIKDQHIILEN